ncbi:hypothetical protein D9M72_594470 [compost metagenome]
MSSILRFLAPAEVAAATVIGVPTTVLVERLIFASFSEPKTYKVPFSSSNALGLNPNGIVVSILFVAGLKTVTEVPLPK